MNKTVWKSLAGALLMSAAASPSLAETRLIVSCIFPPQHFVCQNALPGWLEDVERVTEGRVTGIMTPTSVAPAPEILTAVENGVADVAVQFNGLIGNRITGPLITMIPYVGSRNAEATGAALWALTDAHFNEEFDTVHLLSQFAASPSELYSLKDEPLTSMEDFDGLRLWALAGTLAQLAKETGAGVVATPAVQSNEIVTRGVVDAAMGPDPVAARAFQLIPYIKSVTRFQSGMSNSSFSFFMNQRTWDGIEPADQEAIMSVSGEKFARETSALWDTGVQQVLAQMEEAGIEFIEASGEFEAAMIEKAEGIRSGWIEAAERKGLDGEALLAEFEALLGENAAAQ